MKSRPGFCYWRINLILFRLFAEAHEPVQTILIFVLVVHPLLGYAAAAGGGYDDIIAGSPVGRGGAGVGICLLERQDDALDLVKVAARGQRIVQDGSYHAVGVDDKHRPHRLGVGLSRLDHTVLVGHLHADILDEREGHIDVFLAVPLQLLDLPQPGNVGIDRVHRKPHQLSIERLELVDHRAKGHKLRGADRGEIRGMGEEDHPFAGVILREFDRALRSDSLEGRGLVANKRYSVFLIHGMRSLC